MENNKKNMLVRGTAADKEIVYFSVDSTELVEEARRNHGLSPLSTVVLGRTLTAAALMGQELKSEHETITVMIKGNGPANTVIAVTNNKSEVKGYIADGNLELPLNSIGKFDVAGAIGDKGKLTVVRDMGLKEPYVGQVDIISGEIAEDVAYYYALSQQTPSIVSLGVLIDTDGTVKHAGGFMVQTMPNASETTVTALEELIGGFPSLTFLQEEGFDAGQIMDLLLGRLGFEHTYIGTCAYKCDCSRDRMLTKLLAIGRKDIEEIINDKDAKPVEVVCQFCNMKYRFSKEELASFL